MKNLKISPNAAVFFGIMAVVILAFILVPNSGYSENEKRYLAEFPEVTVEGILDGSVQSGMETWFSDRFPFRDFWVGVNAYAGLIEGRNLQNDVWLCRDNYLINAPKPDGTEQLKKNLEIFDDFAAASGIPASVMIVPTSGYINSELLPAGHPDYLDDNYYAVAADTLKSASLIDVRKPLAEADATAPVFYRTDHHLTAWGSQALLNAYRGGADGGDYSVTTHHGFYGTTWSASGLWLVPSDDIEIWDPGCEVTVTIKDSSSDEKISDSLFFTEHLDALDKYPVYLDGNHPLTIIENHDSDGGKLLIVKDSYAHCFSTLAIKDYSEIVMVDLRYYRRPVSDLISERGITELLFLYGMDNITTDTNSAWLY